MKHILIIFMMLALFFYGHQPNFIQTIYTDFDILYVDYGNLEITFETVPDTLYFRSLNDLIEGVEEITADHSTPFSSDNTSQWVIAIHIVDGEFYYQHAWDDPKQEVITYFLDGDDGSLDVSVVEGTLNAFYAVDEYEFYK